MAELPDPARLRVGERRRAPLVPGPARSRELIRVEPGVWEPLGETREEGPKLFPPLTVAVSVTHSTSSRHSESANSTSFSSIAWNQRLMTSAGSAMSPSCGSRHQESYLAGDSRRTCPPRGFWLITPAAAGTRISGVGAAILKAVGRSGDFRSRGPLLTIRPRIGPRGGGVSTWLLPLTWTSTF